MIRTLFIIAGAALVLSIATLSGAAAISGNDLFRNGWAWRITDGNDNVRIRRVRGDETPEPAVTRTLEWTGGDRLVSALSADIAYVRGDTASVSITGPRALVDRVRLEDGRLTLADGDVPETVTFGIQARGAGAWADHQGLSIVVTAPAVSSFDLAGSGDMDLRGLTGPVVDLVISGSGDISAEGQVDRLELTITGSGDAELADLATKSATVQIAGSGQAKLAPSEQADIAISGSGDVDLTTRPGRINQSITGSGRVDIDG